MNAENWEGAVMISRKNDVRWPRVFFSSLRLSVGWSLTAGLLRNFLGRKRARVDDLTDGDLSGTGLRFRVKGRAMSSLPVQMAFPGADDERWRRDCRATNDRFLEIDLGGQSSVAE